MNDTPAEGAIRAAAGAATARHVEISDPDRLADEPLVSIYMLTYGHERYIASAIEGVIAQQCSFPIELIIGEDCSPDRTGEIVRTYQQRHPELIRIITADVNVGAHANAARCRDACRGEFIAICEGDDYWHHPAKLQMQVDAMRSDPGMSLCHTEFDRRIGFRIKKNRHQMLGQGHAASGEAYVDLLREWSVMTATALYRRRIVDAFRASRFYEPRWPFGDYNLALYASLHGTLGYIPVSTATWRRVSGSASNAGAVKSLAMHLAATECRRRYMDAFPVDPEQAESIERSIQAKSRKLAFWAGNEAIYRTSLDWLVSHGYERPSLTQRLALLAMSLRFPVALLAAARGMLRSLAEFDPNPARAATR